MKQKNPIRAMSDAREVFLTLATSSDLESAIQRAIGLVSESASIRDDLGGNLGEETGKELMISLHRKIIIAS